MRHDRTHPLEQRFFGSFEADPNSGCWLWTGHLKNTGYARIKDQKREFQAHRVSLELHTGESAAGRLVLHSCDTPCCVNPNHLRFGTDAENAADKVKRGRAKYIGQAPRIPSQDRAGILAAIHDGGSNKGIARKFGVSPSSVRRYREGGR